MECSSCDIDFELYPKEKEYLEKNHLSLPRECFKCRLQKRLAFWPYGIFRKRKCDLSGETIVTTFPEGARFPVYKREHWFSDQWNPPEQEVSWERPLLDQFFELQSQTPHFHALGRNNQNCDYTDDSWECKNCYMCRSAADDEDCYRSYRFIGCKDCMDLTYVYNLERCYECTYCFKGFNLKFCFNCRECSDSAYLFDCRGCSNCFLSFNLRNKKYCILNQQYSAEQYKAELEKYNLKSRDTLEKLFDEFLTKIQKEAIFKLDFNTNAVNCSGDFLSNCKNCLDSFFWEDSEDCYYSFRGLKSKDCFDCTGLYEGEVSYNTCQSSALYDCKVTLYSSDCKNCDYIDQCYFCQNCFFCAGLKNKKYCIFNKQYGEKEYFELREQLVAKLHEEGIYGDFFPLKFAYHGYNVSLSSFYFPLEKEEILQMGAYFEEYIFEDKEGASLQNLPDQSDGVDYDFVAKPLTSEDKKERFSFIKQEIDLYKKMDLPFPKMAPEERNRRRFDLLPTIEIHGRKCAKCGAGILTTYADAQIQNGNEMQNAECVQKTFCPQNVFCSDCYLEFVY